MNEDLQALVETANAIEGHVLLDEPNEAKEAITKARALLDAIERALEPAQNVIRVKFN